MKHCKAIWGEDYYILKRKIKDKKLMNLLNEIIYSTKGEAGIPIGNYTSQVFANIYLNEIDQYTKHELKCKYYYKYMDDTVIILKTKEEVKDVLDKIRIF